MVTLIMPSDYGMEILVSSSPVLGSSFLSGGSPYLTDYNRCGPMWSHAPPPMSCIDLTNPVATIQAKPVAHISNFNVSTNSVFDPGPDETTEPQKPFTRNGNATRNSLRSSTRRKRRQGTVDVPLLQNLKSCLINRTDEQEFAAEVGPTSPSRGKKKVSFADMNGNNLTHIKIIRERPDCPPRWSSEFLKQLTGGAKAEAVAEEDWSLTFSQPVANYMSWKSKLESNKVVLENVFFKSQSILSGSIKVKNLSFEKHVSVRYTTNNWFSNDEVTASYVATPGSSYSSYDVYDTFSFALPLPSSSIADKVEFCICYQSGGDTFWDNNNDKNYAIVAFKSKRNAERSPPKDIHNVQMEAWSEFSVWRNLEMNNSPYW